MGSTIETYIQDTGQRGDADNKYTFQFNAVSYDKLLTTLDTAYAIGSIIADAGAPQNLAVESKTINSINVEWDRVYYSDGLRPQI